MKYLFVIASCIYFLGYKEYPMLKLFSPACFALSFGFPIMFLTLNQSRHRMVPILAIAYASIVLVIVALQQLFLDCYAPIEDGITSLVAPALFFPCAWVLFSNASKSELIHSLQLILNTLLIMLAASTIWCWAIPIMKGISLKYFYAYKGHSFYCEDPNYHVINCLVMLQLTYYLEKQTSKSFFKKRVAVLILSFLTLSRALMIGIALYYIYRYILVSIKKGNVVLLSGIVAIAFVALICVLPTIQDDYSFRTKIEILESVQAIQSSPSYDYLLGFGVGNYVIYFKEFLGERRGCHNLAGFAVEMGVLWFILTLIFWYGIYRVTGDFFKILLLPMAAVALISLYPSTFLGPVYLVAAIVGVELTRSPLGEREELQLARPSQKTLRKNINICPICKT